MLERLQFFTSCKYTITLFFFDLLFVIDLIIENSGLEPGRNSRGAVGCSLYVNSVSSSKRT